MAPGEKNDQQKPINRRSPKKSHGNLLRSQSHTILTDSDSALAKKFSEEKLKSKNGSNTRLSGEKAPVTHFCTPKSVSANKKPLRKFFSDNSLPQTPDCYSSVHLETPRAKADNIPDEQTVCDGENSNLTVGVRVRPLSFK